LLFLQCGSTLYAQLEVWKATSSVDRNNPGGTNLLHSWASASMTPCEQSNGGVATPAPQEPSENGELENKKKLFSLIVIRKILNDMYFLI
jgi:hypothetical protein